MVITKNRAICIFFYVEYTEENIEKYTAQINSLDNVDICWEENESMPILVSKIRIFGFPLKYKTYPYATKAHSDANDIKSEPVEEETDNVKIEATEPSSEAIRNNLEYIMWRSNLNQAIQQESNAQQQSIPAQFTPEQSTQSTNRKRRRIEHELETRGQVIEFMNEVFQTQLPEDPSMYHQVPISIKDIFERVMEHTTIFDDKNLQDFVNWARINNLEFLKLKDPKKRLIKLYILRDKFYGKMK